MKTALSNEDHLRCEQCGYDLHEVTRHRCPECGKTFNPHLRPPNLNPAELIGIALRLFLMTFVCFALSLIPFVGVFLGALVVLFAVGYTFFPASQAAQLLTSIMRKRSPGIQRRWGLIEMVVGVLIYSLTVALCIMVAYAGCAIVLDGMGL